MICCLAAAVAHLLHFSCAGRKGRRGWSWLTLLVCRCVLMCVCAAATGFPRYQGKGKSLGPRCRASLISHYVSLCRGSNEMIVVEAGICTARCTAPLHYTIKHNTIFHTERTVGVKDERALSKGEKESTESKKRQQCSVNLA